MTKYYFIPFYSPSGAFIHYVEVSEDEFTALKKICERNGYKVEINVDKCEAFESYDLDIIQ